MFGQRAAIAALAEPALTGADDAPAAEPIRCRLARDARAPVARRRARARSAETLRTLLDDPHPLARIVGQCALLREESRGGHQRSDFPETDAALDGQPRRDPGRRCTGFRVMGLRRHAVVVNANSTIATFLPSHGDVTVQRRHPGEPPGRQGAAQASCTSSAGPSTASSRRDIDATVCVGGVCAQEHVLRSCEATIERLVSDRHYFARPSRTLFNDIRTCFPMRAQSRVWAVVQRYVNAADEYLQRLPSAGLRRQRPAASVPRDDAARHALSARPAPPQRLLPQPPAPRGDRGAGARRGRVAHDAAGACPDTVRACSSGSTSAARSLTPSSSPVRQLHTRQGADHARRSVGRRHGRDRRRLERAGARPADVELLAHGMTVATNALLEGRGARTAFVATEGFTDLIELGRQARRDLYRLCAAWPAPFAPPERRFGAPERVAPDGVLRAARGSEARWPTRSPRASPEAVAVCLLHAYRDPAHERALGDALRARLGEGVHVSLSHEVVGTFREFERAATTEVDAALSPLVGAYLRALAGRAARRGPARAPDHAVQRRPRGARRPPPTTPRSTVLSGPAGGAAAAVLVAAAAGEPRAAVLRHGRHVVRRLGRRRTASCARRRGARSAAGRSRCPMVDIHTVGAGGGSIGWRDAGGALRVGPRSAGAEPGPACYGRGGTEPTVTDANLVLGRLDAVTAVERRAAERRGGARARSSGSRRSSASGSSELRAGHRARGQRRDGAGAARDDRRARPGPARVHAAGVRRRRPAARRRAGRRARHHADPDPAGERRAQRGRPRRCGPPRASAAHAAAARRRSERRGARRTPSTSCDRPGSASRSPATCATAGRRTS